MTRILYTEVKSGERLVATDITNLTFFPKGTILIFSSEAWNATSAEFKSIWKICNGQNGTPNLVDKFLRGAESSNFTTPGGADSQSVRLTVNNLPSHNHSMTVYQQDFISSHGHGTYGLNEDTYGTSQYDQYKQIVSTHPNNGLPIINYTGGGQPFTVNTVPACCTVIYIMKVA
jgi:hypothetical protein